MFFCRPDKKITALITSSKPPNPPNSRNGKTAAALASIAQPIKNERSAPPRLADEMKRLVISSVKGFPANEARVTAHGKMPAADSPMKNTRSSCV